MGTAFIGYFQWTGKANLVAVSFLILVNEIAKRISDGRCSEIMDGDELFVDHNIDSLNLLMLGSYIIEFYGLPPELEKDWMPKTVNEMYQVVWNQKTKEPASIQECLEVVQ